MLHLVHHVKRDPRDYPTQSTAVSIQEKCHHDESKSDSENNIQQRSEQCQRLLEGQQTAIASCPEDQSGINSLIWPTDFISINWSNCLCSIFNL